MLTIPSEIAVGDLALLVGAGCAVVITAAFCLDLLRPKPASTPRLRIAVRGPGLRVRLVRRKPA
jgi:hypothetical protein